MTNPKNTSSQIYGITNSILTAIGENLQSSSSKAALANLRNSIGRNVSASMSAWQIVLEKLPEEFLSRSGELTREEKAIMSSLQLYALHQQGKGVNVHFKPENGDGFRMDMGASLHSLKVSKNEKDQDSRVAMDRRFNVMITASTFEELLNHLRPLINLLSKNELSKVDYAQLATDLYWFQSPANDHVRLRWAQNYYKQIKEEKKK